MEMRRQLNDATSEFALTVGIPKHNESDIIYAHIFGGPYDLWVKDYNPTERVFFGFASFGGIDDQDAEFGYVSLDELLEQSPKLERDLYWTPCTFDSLQNPVVQEVWITEDVNKHTEFVAIEDEDVNKPFVFAREREQVEPVFEFSRDEASQFIAKYCENGKGKSIPELKEQYCKSQAWGGGPLTDNYEIDHMFYGYRFDIKGCIISHEYRSDTQEAKIEHQFDLVDIWNILNSTQQAIPIEPIKEKKPKAQKLPEDLPFKQEVTAPEIMPRTYQATPKYEVIERSSDLSVRDSLNRLSQNSGVEGKDKFLSYSGNGKLHDVEWKDYGNFHDYTKAKQEYEMGQFYTPDWLCQSIVNLCEINDKVNVMDPTCGTGRFFNWLPNEQKITGIENDYDSYSTALKAFSKGTLYLKSFISYLEWRRGAMSYMLGNPPFNLRFTGQFDHPLATDNDEEDGGEGNVLSQNHFIKCCEYYLEDGWVAAFVVPDTFLEQELRDKKVNAFIDEHFWRVATIRLNIDTFSEYKIKFPTKVLVLMKKHPDLKYDLPQVETTFTDFYLTEQGQWFYKAKKQVDQWELRRKYKANKQKADAKQNLLVVRDKLLKAIYEYKHCANFKEDKLEEYRDMYAVARQKPMHKAINAFEKLTKDIWRAIKHKHKSELFIRIYPSMYHINFERSNGTVSEYVNNNLKFTEPPFYNLPNRLEKNGFRLFQSTWDEYNFWMAKLTEKKHIIKYKGVETEIKIINELWKNYLQYIKDKAELNNTPTGELKDKYDVQYEMNMEMLEEIRFGWRELLPHQKEDLAGMLMKDYALVSWDTGLGKTMGGIAYTYIKGGRTLVLAPSVNTIDPWLQQLKEYAPDRTIFLCKSTKDITKYKWEDYLICSIEGTPNLYESLTRWRFKNLILDESDNIKSKTSSRAKAIKALAKRIDRKILMSGTPTRNNILEIYNQVEILCRNSANMICWAETQWEYDRSSRDYNEERNPNYLKPFPAWGGHKAFERTFSPRKVTCFGANETNQDIINAEKFKQLIEPIRFTRIYDVEKPRINLILGIEDMDEYKDWKPVIVPMSEHEWKVYDWILEEFAKIVEEHYRQYHDGSTASKLVIMRQILELLQGTSHPWTYLNYEWEKVGTKLLKALEIIEQAKLENRKVMIASPWVETAAAMYELFESKGFPVFRITTEMSKPKRAQLVHEFRNWPGFAIITGTMGCLKSWLNLPEVSVVIAESYPWNMAQLKQYAARAIRLNSTEKTIIRCLCSEWSFDVNVFGLLVKKEVTNEFVRTSTKLSTEDIRAEMGVSGDDDFYQSALRMVHEKVNGRMRGSIKWNEKQSIS